MKKEKRYQMEELLEGKPEKDKRTLQEKMIDRFKEKCVYMLSWEQTVLTPKDILKRKEKWHGYREALFDAKIITTEQYKELGDLEAETINKALRQFQ